MTVVLQKRGPHCTAHLHSTTLTMAAADDTTFNGAAESIGTAIGIGTFGTVNPYPTQPSQHELMTLSYDVSLMDRFFVAIFISRLHREVRQTLHPY